MNTDVISPLQEQVEIELQEYFRILNGQNPSGVYDMVIGEVEKALFRVVLEHCDGNQSRAAAYLGINRGTLRKKLALYKLC
ncbi:Fis family transcriptional regulator [Chromatiales bacterium (ex Bugula neritina AB1)]|nr:Fis family transcriptional regulator [Chromatiales bacterium (ex Bugula neritina AB1)]